MSLIEIQWKPTDRQVRQFAAICLIGLPLLTWWWGGGTTAIQIVTGIAALLSVMAWIRPTLIAPLLVVSTLITAPIGMVIGEVIMLLIFLTVFCPLALIFRLIGRDVLQRQIDRSRPSYWEPKAAATSVASYYRQS